MGECTPVGGEILKQLELKIESGLGGREIAPENIRPLSLAYVGDTILDLYVRTRLVSETTLHPKELHQKASAVVNAAAQARMVKLLMEDLTEEEKEVFRKARNQHSGTIPKNQSPIDYKWATGLEALLGYLYLKGETERLAELIGKGLGYIGFETAQEKDKSNE